MSLETSLRDYVMSAAALLDLPLDDERVTRVVMHLGNTAVMAKLLETVPLAFHDELAEIYCPAVFPGSTDERNPL
jgi:hypothetical protein